MLTTRKPSQTSSAVYGTNITDVTERVTRHLTLGSPRDVMILVPFRVVAALVALVQRLGADERDWPR